MESYKGISAERLFRFLNENQKEVMLLKYNILNEVDKMKTSDKTLTQIFVELSEKHCISYERVRQIYYKYTKKNGLTSESQTVLK